jgi:hypothetical protein
LLVPNATAPYQSLKETAYLLRSPENARRLLASIDRLEHGGGSAYDLLATASTGTGRGASPTNTDSSTGSSTMRSASPPAATTTGSDSRPDRLHVLSRQELVEAGVLGGFVVGRVPNRELLRLADQSGDEVVLDRPVDQDTGARGAGSLGRSSNLADGRRRPA